MQIEISSVLRFPLQCPYREKVVENLRLENPDYKSAKAFSPYSAKSMPQFRYYYQDDIYNKQTVVPVGKKEELFAYCAICPHKCPVVDFRTTGQVVKAFEFKERITPRPSQVRAMTDIQNSVAYTGNGLVVMPTGCGKTFLSFLISQMANKSTIFITHTIDLAEQTASAYETLTGIKPGFIGDRVYDINPTFTVAIIDTLYSRKNYEEISEIFGMALFDEVHLLPAESCIEVLNSITIKYIIGFTATPRRGDGLTPVIYGCFGNIVTKVTIEEAQKEGSLVPLHAEILLTDYQSLYSEEQIERKKSLLNAAIKEASLDLGRNKVTASKTEELCDFGHSVLLVLQNIDQCQIMYDLLKDRPGVRAEIFVGQIGKKKFSRKQRKAIIDRARTGETNVLITVQLAGMGLDVPRLTALIMDRKITDPTAVEQIVGRIVRACPSLGKVGAVVYDVYDQYVPFFVRQTNKRFQVYHKFRKFE